MYKKFTSLAHERSLINKKLVVGKLTALVTVKHLPAIICYSAGKSKNLQMKTEKRTKYCKFIYSEHFFVEISKQESKKGVAKSSKIIEEQ